MRSLTLVTRSTFAVVPDYNEFTNKQNFEKKKRKEKEKNMRQRKKEIEREQDTESYKLQVG